MEPEPAATDPVHVPYASVASAPCADSWWMRAVPRIQWLLCQGAHRACALAIWLLTARLVLAFFSYDPEVLAWILILAALTPAAALILALAAYWLARGCGRSAAEPLSLVVSSLALFAIPAAWMILDLVFDLH